jgi:hypothetical protein
MSAQLTKTMLRRKGDKKMTIQTTVQPKDKALINGSNGSETMTSATETDASIYMIEEVKAQVEAVVKAKLEQALVSPAQPEIAEPLNWWDIYAFGPFQPGANSVPPSGFAGPLLPHQVIRTGETAFVATVMILNPVGPAIPSALDILSNFALPYQVEYATGELKRWQPGPASLQHQNTGNLVPGVAVYVDVFAFVAQDPGLYEMNICARIFGCEGNAAPPFSGFATWVYDPDQDYLGSLLGQGGPGFYHKDPIRFQVYK